MLNYFIIEIMICVSLMILGCLIQCLVKHKTQTGYDVAKMLGAGFLIITTYMLALYIQNRLISEIFYNIYFFANTLFCYFTFLFSLRYTQLINTPKKYERLFAIPVIFDGISIMMNIKYHNLCYFFESQTSQTLVFNLRTSTIFFECHLFLCYIFLFSFFALNIIKAIKSPFLYKLKFIFFPTVIGICVIVNFIALEFFTVSMDFMIFSYGLIALLIFFTTFNFLPAKLKKDIQRKMIKGSRLYIIFFDKDDVCIFKNKNLDGFIDMQNEIETRKDLVEYLEINDSLDDIQQIVSVSKNGVNVFYNIFFHKLTDKKNRYIGCYYIFDNITASHNQEEINRYRLTHDKLTDILNSTAFYTEAKKVLLKNVNEQYCIIKTNISKFSLLNTYLGRKTCDNILRSVAKIFAQINITDSVWGRFEDDKFILCVPKKFYAENLLLEKLDQLNNLGNYQINISNFIGVYEISDISIPITVMCDFADIALNTAKESKTSKIVYYNEKLKDDVQLKFNIASQVQNGLRERQFKVYFQPQIDCLLNSITGAEALVRWEHPTYGMLYPDLFIPQFEKSGLIYNLDKYVWKESCRYLKELHEQGIFINFSVNVSPYDIYSGEVDKDFILITKEYGIDPKYLNIEITETALIIEKAKLIRTIENLKNYGFKIEMDDFGSGYSSLNTLKDINVDVIKMDMHFLDDTENIERSHRIIKLIVDLSNSLNVPLIAEGVEKKEQVEYLSSIGCFIYQGFFYSKAIPFEELKRFVTEFNVKFS